MDFLRPVIRPYPWGTRTAIAELQGRPVPAPGPEAELWMGAHPSAPSGVGWTTLDEVIAAAPERALGVDCAGRFGGRLPFLLKVLSAEKALSIQVHPSRAQAQAGYAAENARGLAADDPARNYVDDWPKPELLCALTPFEVAAGLRPPSDASALLSALEVDELKPLAAGLTDPSANLGADLGAALAAILEWPDPRPLVASVVAACQRLADAGGPHADACAAAVRVAADHPGDIGVVALLLMRHAVLQPGQAVFMPAGGLHAYLRGTGIELLANSDNVVRSGLTGKHIDVPELLKLLDPSVDVPVLSPRPLADGIATFDTPAPEFRLYLIDLPASPAPSPPASASPALASLAPALALPATGPRVLLCLDGACTLRAETGQELDLTRGDSCFIPFADGPIHATGQARLIQATPGGAVS
ncbi:MAG TPA: mannose-6-phosphate isomerase, class I [Candidatus Dormibacteraeota bacterium]|nr:mannose-6-phosphate isomerase, class I [Candidatus Dormibacteraeota bacterium]